MVAALGAHLVAAGAKPSPLDLPGRLVPAGHAGAGGLRLRTAARASGRPVGAHPRLHPAASLARTNAAARPGRGRPAGTRRRRRPPAGRRAAARRPGGPAARARRRASTAARPRAARPGRPRAAVRRRPATAAAAPRPASARRAPRAPAAATSPGTPWPARRPRPPAAASGREPLVVEPRPQRLDVPQPLDRHRAVRVPEGGEQVQPRRAR